MEAEKLSACAQEIKLRGKTTEYHSVNRTFVMASKRIPSPHR